MARTRRYVIRGELLAENRPGVGSAIETSQARSNFPENGQMAQPPHFRSGCGESAASIAARHAA